MQKVTLLLRNSAMQVFTVSVMYILEQACQNKCFLAIFAPIMKEDIYSRKEKIAHASLRCLQKKAIRILQPKK